jgi:hypothetical protein
MVERLPDPTTLRHDCRKGNRGFATCCRVVLQVPPIIARMPLVSWAIPLGRRRHAPCFPEIYGNRQSHKEDGYEKVSAGGDDHDARTLYRTCSKHQLCLSRSRWSWWWAGILRCRSLGRRSSPGHGYRSCRKSAPLRGACTRLRLSISRSCLYQSRAGSGLRSRGTSGRVGDSAQQMDQRQVGTRSPSVDSTKPIDDRHSLCPWPGARSGHGYQHLTMVDAAFQDVL